MEWKKGSTPHRKNIMIYQHEIDLECMNGTTYWVITEIVDYVPVRTFYYKIPEDYKKNGLLGKIHELYNPYCPN
jgi:hypothetical protein